MEMPYVGVIDPKTGALCGIIDVYTSLVTRSRLNDVGDWELNLPATPDVINLLRVGRMVTVPGYWGMIDEIEISQTDDGTDEMVVSGTDLNGLMALRLALPEDGAEYALYSGDAASVMCAIVEDNAINAGAIRSYPQLHIGAVDGSGAIIERQTRYELVSAALHDIATANGLAWRIRYADGDMLLDIRFAQDHSASSDSPVIYSPEYDNISSQSYTHSLAGSANVALAAGAGTGAEREVCWVGDVQAAGLERRETYLALKKYTSLEDDATAQLLDKYAEACAFEGSLLAAGPYQYGVDWQLGDMITVQHLGWGVSMDVVVTEMERAYEGDTIQQVATFGEGRITLVDVLKRAIAPVDEDLRR